jgi:hypothetical protein
MANSQDTQSTSQKVPSLLFENVNKILSTFIPAHHRRGSSQVK